jgi:hypothetical protein
VRATSRRTGIDETVEMTAAMTKMRKFLLNNMVTGRGLAVLEVENL